MITADVGGLRTLIAAAAEGTFDAACADLDNLDGIVFNFGCVYGARGGQIGWPSASGVSLRMHASALLSFARSRMGARAPKCAAPVASHASISKSGGRRAGNCKASALAMRCCA